MEKKTYKAPRVFELGTVKELTQGANQNDDLPDKCGGSGDASIPGLWAGGLVLDCPGPAAGA